MGRGARKGAEPSEKEISRRYTIKAGWLRTEARKVEEGRTRWHGSTVDAKGNRPGQRSHDSHGTLSYLPDRAIPAIILANLIDLGGPSVRSILAVTSASFVSASMNTCNQRVAIELTSVKNTLDPGETIAWKIEYNGTRVTRLSWIEPRRHPNSVF